MTQELSIEVPMRYVAFCDVLGFSNAVESSFDATIKLYETFMERMRDWPFPKTVEVMVYSDSILMVSDELPGILSAVKTLWFAALTNDWLIRGGIAYGKYWARQEQSSFFVVSDALVRAVRLESSVKVPAIAISSEIELPISAWTPRFEHNIFDAPLLHFRGLSLVNPFNPYWFLSARLRVEQLLIKHPEHVEKYRWFLELASDVNADECLVPEAALAEMLTLGILVDKGQSEQTTLGDQKGD